MSHLHSLKELEKGGKVRARKKKKENRKFEYLHN